MTRNYSSQLGIDSDVEKGLLLDERKSTDTSLFKNYGVPPPHLHSRSIRRVSFLYLRVFISHFKKILA